MPLDDDPEQTGQKLQAERQRAAILEHRVADLESELEESKLVAGRTDALRGELDQLDARLDHMTELGKELNALSFDQVRDACERHLPFVVAAHRMSVYVLDEDGRSLRLVAHNHERPVADLVSVGDDSRSMMRIAMEEGRTVVVRNVDEFRDQHGLPSGAGSHAADYKTKSCVIAPLISGGKILGVLNLADKKDGTDFTESTDRKFIQQIADLVAIALRNSLLLEKLRRVQSTDGLTQLMNRPAFIAALDNEVKRSRRYGAPLALILVDVERFRLINGNHGHAVGDRVLGEVAALLTRSVREIDVVGRYGGDEFGIILPQQDAEGAQVVADRLSLLNCELDGPQGSRSIIVKLTVATSILERQQDSTALLERTEEALLHAKRRAAERDAAPEVDPAD